MNSDYHLTMMCETREAARQWYAFLKYALSTLDSSARLDFVSSDNGECGYSFTVCEDSGALAKIVSELKSLGVVSASVSIGDKR